MLAVKLLTSKGIVAYTKVKTKQKVNVFKQVISNIIYTITSR